VDLNEILAANENVVLSITVDNHDPYDEFAWVQGWRFAIWDFLYFERGESVDGFRPAYEPENSYEFETLQYENPTSEVLRDALSVLDSYREWLGSEGRDY
jgi:hypothetical protein